MKRRNMLRLGALAAVAPGAMAAPAALPTWEVIGGMTVAELLEEMDRRRAWEQESTRGLWLSQVEALSRLAKEYYVPLYSGGPYAT